MSVRYSSFSGGAGRVWGVQQTAQVQADWSNVDPDSPAYIDNKPVVLNGAIGVAGATGPQGVQRVQGEKGEVGDPGEPGEEGEQGKQGEEGKEGPEGPEGAPGIEGIPGVPGVPGVPGIPGIPGIPGASGASGSTGEQGANGENDTAEEGCYVDWMQPLSSAYHVANKPGIATLCSSNCALPAITTTTGSTSTITSLVSAAGSSQMLTAPLLVPSTESIIFGADVSGKEANAGTIQYALKSLGLDVFGAGSAIGSRLLSLWDNVQVEGNLTVTGNLIVEGNASISGSTAGSGWTTLIGGSIMQWGSCVYYPANAVSAGVMAGTVTFPQSYTTGPVSITLTAGESGASGDSPSPVLCVFQKSATTFTYYYRVLSGAKYSSGLTGYYQAIGI